SCVCPCTAIDTGGCERDRARDVACRLRRPERLRHGLGHRRLPLPAGHPRARAEHPPLQEGCLTVAAAAPAIEVPAPRDTAAAKVLRAIAKAPVQILLGALGLLWLVPTFGLFITSILPASAFASKGWWQIFTHPSVATWSNYHALFQNSGLTNA